MKKVLLISYFFPPCNLTASHRIQSWAQYLREFGYYPIVITRKWERHISSFKDCHYSTSEQVVIEKKGDFEVHYLPYKANLRDKLHTSNLFPFLKKFLSLSENIIQNFRIGVCPFSNILSHAQKVIADQKTETVVISGNPFIQFAFGYKLHKQFKIKWIADYRDAWTTSTINNLDNNPIKNILNSYNKLFERKWIKTASCVTASSNSIGSSISNLTGIPSHSIYNGFEPDDFVSLDMVEKNKTEFQIVYVGTLYDGQDITIFLDAYKQFIDDLKPNVKLLFPGLNINKHQKQRIDQLMSGYARYYETSDRVMKSKILTLETSSHLLLHVGWHEHKGIIASKIYEYIGSGSEIIVCPGDNDAIDSIVAKAQAGVICNSVNEAYRLLVKRYKLFENQQYEKFNKINKERLQFERKQQVKKLAFIIDTLNN